MSTQWITYCHEHTVNHMLSCEHSGSYDSSEHTVDYMLSCEHTVDHMLSQGFIQRGGGLEFSLPRNLEIEYGYSIWEVYKFSWGEGGGHGPRPPKYACMHFAHYYHPATILFPPPQLKIPVSCDPLCTHMTHVSVQWITWLMWVHSGSHDSCECTVNHMTVMWAHSRSHDCHVSTQ